MVELMKRIIVNVLTALYQPFGFAIILTFLFMFLYICVKEYGWKEAINLWFNEFKSSSVFRRVFLLVFYTAMILFKTLLSRSMWINPLSNVIGIWGIFNENGDLTTETIENMVLFIPFIIILLWCFHKKIIGERTKMFVIIWKSMMTVVLVSLTIEFAQLFLRLGTFQLSDIFYNTLGGFIGGFIYWCGYKLTYRRKTKVDE